MIISACLHWKFLVAEWIYMKILIPFQQDVFIKKGHHTCSAIRPKVSHISDDDETMENNIGTTDENRIDPLPGTTRFQFETIGIDVSSSKQMEL